MAVAKPDQAVVDGKRRGNPALFGFQRREVPKLQSSLIGKIEKANRYAQEPERVSIKEFKATFRGGNGDHDVSFSNGAWNCSCEFFQSWHLCCHTMALEKLLDPMVPIQSTEVVGALRGE